ncbi:MAG: hypothetical protein KatS3mg129_0115 [Leptospiraceae bacterium]|nr:MAG: hypothetical protein KatS3mg129_0115 [Leptospiraceae bacterium]
MTNQNHIYSIEKIDKILENIYENVFKLRSFKDILTDINLNLDQYDDFVFIWTGIYNKEKQFIQLVSFSDHFNFRFDQLEKELNQNFDLKLSQDFLFHINNDITEIKKNYYTPIFKDILMKNFIYSYLIFGLPINPKETILICLFTQKKGYFVNAFVEKIHNFQKNLSIFINFINNIKYNANFYSAIEQSKTWFLITDENGIIEYVNPYVEKITGYSKKELIGKKTNIFKSGLQPTEFYKKLWTNLNQNISFYGTFINLNKYNELFYIKQHIIPVETFQNKKKYISIGFLNQDSSHLYNLDIEFFDPLTKLPNEAIFLNYINNQLEYNKNKIYAMYYIGYT